MLNLILLSIASFFELYKFYFIIPGCFLLAGIIQYASTRKGKIDPESEEEISS